MSENLKTESEKKIPEEFSKVAKDFYKDILLVFPETKEKLSIEIIEFLQDKNDGTDLFHHCLSVYPERFFDILYQNEDIFEKTDINTEFLPNIDFKELWNQDDVSENTKKTMWKYLQLILFSVSSSLKNGKDFGDTEKLFEAIDQDEMKRKLEETMKEMSDMFNSNMDENQENFMNSEDLPNPEDLQNHISGLMEGKLGRLAQEIANETAQDMDIDIEDNSSTNVGDVFQKLLKNPTKLMDLVKNIGSKLDKKLKSGEIKESELMQEAADLMEKMKQMPGMKNMNKIFSKMGIPMGKNQKMSANAFQSRINQNMKMSKQKERMLRKLEQKRTERELLEKMRQANENKKVDTYTHLKFKGNKEETVEKSSRVVNKKKKKKKKKKKNKN